ncbi:MAG: histidine phosphatase family protein [Gammaproteobacteria bacterium]
MSSDAVSTGDVSTTVDLLRHGEPRGGRRFRGQTDDPLSERGWRQMWQAVGGTAMPWQHVVSSPLQRCSAFARELADRHRLPCSLEPGFKEIRFGVWEGLTPEQILSREPENYRRYRDDPERCMPAGAESMAEFVARVTQAWEAMLAAQQGRHILLVCHAGVIRAVLSAVLGIKPRNLFRVQIDYGCLSRFTVDKAGPPTLVFHGGSLP